MERQDRQAVRTDPLSTQALIIGAGPVGLYQAFQLGLLGMDCHLVDVLPHVGGQCVELYADKPIYDIAGLPRCTGRELIERLQQQISPFAPPMHLGHQVTELHRLEAGGFQLHTDLGLSITTPHVVLAAGVGAFLPRSLPLEGLQSLSGVCHAHQPMPSPAQAPHVVLAGSDEQILPPLKHWLAQPTASLTLLHRRSKLDLHGSDAAWVKQCLDSGRLRLVVGQAIGLAADDGALQALHIAPPDGDAFDCPCQVLVQCLGLSPKLGPLADWGLAMSKRRIEVNTRDFGTSEPGIHAVGDINFYPGKRKLIMSGFHEATLAAYGVAERLSAGPVTLEYTTASAKLHQRLKV
jgi:thioredoxin reductase (NADPH)